MIRFLHSSDLHLGKPFGRFPEDVRVRLRQARQDSLSRLTAIARENAATHILLAGDTLIACMTPSSLSLTMLMPIINPLMISMKPIKIGPPMDATGEVLVLWESSGGTAYVYRFI